MKTIRKSLLFLLALIGAAFFSGAAYADYLPTVSALAGVTDVASAVNAIEAQANELASIGQLDTAAGMSKMAAVAETATYRAASSSWLDDSSLDIGAFLVNQLTTVAIETRNKAEEYLTSLGLEPEREIPVAIRFRLKNSDISLRIMPDILTTAAKLVVVETPLYQMSFYTDDLADDLDVPLTISLSDVSQTSKVFVEVKMSNRSLAGFILISIPMEDGEPTDFTVLQDEDGKSTACRYNDITNALEGKVSVPGTYKPTEDGRSVQFTDLGTLEASMRNAIERLYARNITDGTSATTYTPYGKITRGAFVKLIVNAIHRYNERALSPYSDVREADYYYHHAASANKYGFMQGYADNTFRGATNLTKAHICKILGEILERERRFKVGNQAKYLEGYHDAIPDYAKKGVALLTKIGALEPKDGTFDNHDMTRGEVAVLLDAILDKLM